MDSDDVCILIPTYNEEATIGEVIDGFLEQGYSNIFVMDGDSDDRTREIAEEKGARVAVQSGSGKGQAVQEAIGMIESPYVVLIDGDMTYLPREVDKLLEPLERGYDHVIGDRRQEENTGAFKFLNRLGNKIFNFAFRLAHGEYLDDILSGYRAFTLKSIKRLKLREEGFGIETEMSVEALKHDQRLLSVPITYEPRPEDSETNLHPIKDGARIAYTIFYMTRTSNPFFYFGSIGGLLFFGGFLSGSYVLYEKYINNVNHNLLAVLTALLIIAGLQLFVFAALSDVIVELHREQMREMRLHFDDEE